MVSDFSLKNGFIFDKNEGYWAGQRDPSPSPESQRVLERSDFYFGKRNHFCQSYEWYAKLKITYFVQTRCANTRSLRSLAGWLAGGTEICITARGTVVTHADMSGWTIEVHNKTQNKTTKGTRLYFSLVYWYTYEDIWTYSKITNTFYIWKKLKRGWVVVRRNFEEYEGGTVWSTKNIFKPNIYARRT